MSSSSSSPTYGFSPRENGLDGAHLPLVILTDLDDDQTAHLMQHLQASTKNENLALHPWHPSRQIFHSITEQGPHLDSQANLYATAVLAIRAGWAGVLVADELTKRQLTGTLRVGEYPTTSVVMISNRPGSQEGQHRILAKRTAGPTWPRGEDESELVHEDFLTELSSFELGPANREENPFADSSLALHDPDRRPFSPDTSALLERVIHPDTETDATLIELPKNVIHHGKDHLNVFLLYATTPEEQRGTEAALQEALRLCQTNAQEAIKEDGDECAEPTQLVQANLIPWENHRATSRRQLIKLWEAYQRLLPLNDLARDIFLLGQPIQDVNCVELGVVSSFMRGGINFAQVSLNQVVPIGRFGDACDWSPPDYETEGVELVFPPEQPFYVTTPPWQPTSYSLNWISAFYLTNTLTSEQDKAIRNELVKISDHDWADTKTVCYVPWTKDESRDGNLDDMWEVFWDLYTYKRGRAVPCGTSLPAFFIDWQSGIDQTVTAVAPDHLYVSRDNPSPMELLKGIDAPKLRGFKYNRIPGWLAHSAFVNCSIANMDFEEFGEEEQVKTYPRPGWPGHGVLIDDE